MGFFLLLKNTGKILGKYISKTLRGKYSQKLLDHAKKSAIDAFKTAWKIAVEQTAEATGDLIYNKDADRITKVSKTNNLETVTN